MKIRVIQIDPFACEVKHVEIESSALKSYYAALSHETMPVNMMQVIPVTEGLHDGDALFVDEEGLSKQPERFFVFRGFAEPLAGKGLIIGSNPAGDERSAQADVNQIRERVAFLMRTPSGHIVRATGPWIKETTH